MPEARKPVWRHGRVVTDECPKPLVSGASVRWMELFQVWQHSTGVDLTAWPAKDVDAISVLAELLKEWTEEEHGRNKRTL